MRPCALEHEANAIRRLLQVTQILMRAARRAMTLEGTNAGLDRVFCDKKGWASYDRKCDASSNVKRRAASVTNRRGGQRNLHAAWLHGTSCGGKKCRCSVVMVFLMRLRDVFSVCLLFCCPRAVNGRLKVVWYAKVGWYGWVVG